MCGQTALAHWSKHRLSRFQSSAIGIAAAITTVLTVTVPSGMAQASTSSATTNPVQESPELLGQICVSVANPHGTIALGQGDEQIDITLIGGACEPPGSGISMLWVRYPAGPSRLDVVTVKDCPKYQIKIDELWSAKPHHERTRNANSKVRVGSFWFSDPRDLFNLRNVEGRRAAAKWVRETLVAVGACWNTIREDQTLYVVDDLYRRLSLPLPSQTLPSENFETAPHQK